MNGELGMETSQGTKTSSEAAFRIVDYSSQYPGVFGLHFDLPNQKVNKLDDRVMSELDRHIQTLSGRTDIKTLVLFSDKEGIFIAGADIQMIQGVRDKETGSKLAASGQAVIAKLETLKFPVIAAVHGACMGGGTELALCCKYIVTSDAPSTKIALPEVNLGILPGFGGTVRLPERIGLQGALDYILSGKNMDGSKAVKIGFADACVPAQDFKARVLKIASEIAAGKFRSQKRPVVGQAKLQRVLLERTPIGRAVMFNQARKMVMSRTRGKYPAPLKILDLLSRQAGVSRQKKLKLESAAFGELAVTDVSKRLIELFFATEAIKKQTGVPGFKLGEKDKIQRAGLLGAGVMGGGIAQLLAHKQIPVRMKDISYAGLSAGMAASSKIFSGLVKKRKLTKREAEIRLGMISPTLDYSGFGAVDVVIEAVLEDMNVKKKVIKEVEPRLKSDAVFATNTSSLSVTEMATACDRPENFVGMHFFNPVHRMPLIEVIRGEKTSDRAAAMIFDLSKKLGKTPIIVKDGPGFLVNRLLMPYLNEASYLMAEGAPIPELDEHVLDFGMPMGPATLLDEIGIDVAVKVAKVLHQQLGSRAMPCDLNDKLVAAKLYGKKASKGFYLYDSKGMRGELNPEIYKTLGVTPRSPSKAAKEDWIPRMIFLMINEAALCLDEGIASKAEDVDIGMIMGTGFPPFRGGLLRYADSVGLATVVKKLEELTKKVGPRFTPVQPLVDLAKNGKGFYAK